MSCTTHHHACDCREAQFQKDIEHWKMIAEKFQQHHIRVLRQRDQAREQLAESAEAWSQLKKQLLEAKDILERLQSLGVTVRDMHTRLPKRPETF
jgi:hypothetical protein